MKVAVDTNVLVRAVVRDDSAQASVAAKMLTDAELIAVALPCLCEFVWVLLRVYSFQSSDAADAIRALIAAANVEVNRPAVEAGLSVLEAGGDFADGVIAYEGNWLGGEIFVSFDKKAVALLTAQGQSACLLQ
jgi:predicted nucleic-acid-binding protein